MSKLAKTVRRSKPEKRRAAPALPVREPVRQPAREEERPPARSRARRAQKPVQEAQEPAPAPKVQDEPEAVQVARKRLRAMIKQATGDAPPEAIGLVLAILTQETGNHAAANTLIAEYGLDKTFGIKKF